MFASVTFPALGTTAALVVEPADVLDRARELLQGELDAIDLACSRFRDDSELSRLNASGSSWFVVSPRFMEALDVARRGAQLTDGLVDPTIGSALRVLGYDRDFAAIDRNGPPLQVSVQRVAGWRTIEVDEARCAVRLPRGVSLDFGATAKALCADRAASAVARATGACALVGLGGDVAVGGPPRDGGWPVLVADDHAAPGGDSDECVMISSGGLATSGTTNRRWARGERVLHHVVDPFTGEPAVEIWRTVSVCAATCVDANIASTAALVLGAGAPEWLAERALPARLVAADGTVVCTPGWPASAGAVRC